MNRPDVSVCIVTFNQAAYVARCLQSVVAQLPGGRLEVLVGDDGSSDATRAIISEFAAHYPEIVIPLFRETNLGPSENYRDLVARARGRYVAHLDGDDYWLPGKLIRQLAVLDTAPDASAILCNALVVDAGNSPLGFFTSARAGRIDLDFLIARGNFLCHGSLLYRAELRELVLGIPGSFIDYMILVRFAAQAPLVYLDEALVAYRFTATSTRATMRQLVDENHWSALREGLRLGVAHSAFRSGMARFLEFVFATCLLHGDGRRAWSWIGRVRRESELPVTAPVVLALLRIPLSAIHLIRRKIGMSLFRRISVLYRR